MHFAIALFKMQLLLLPESIQAQLCKYMWCIIALTFLQGVHKDKPSMVKYITNIDIHTLSKLYMIVQFTRGSLLLFLFFFLFFFFSFFFFFFVGNNSYSSKDEP